MKKWKWYFAWHWKNWEFGSDERYWVEDGEDFGVKSLMLGPLTIDRKLKWENEE